jgi:hypothetical protein
MNLDCFERGLASAPVARAVAAVRAAKNTFLIRYRRAGGRVPSEPWGEVRPSTFFAPKAKATMRGAHPRMIKKRSRGFAMRFPFHPAPAGVSRSKTE